MNSFPQCKGACDQGRRTCPSPTECTDWEFDLDWEERLTKGERSERRFILAVLFLGVCGVLTVLLAGCGGRMEDYDSERNVEPVHCAASGSECE